MSAPADASAAATVQVYQTPAYYDIAFSTRNIRSEVEFLSRLAPEARDCLEIASGNSPHMAELLSRGYRYTGLELSSAMIEHARATLAVDAAALLLQGDLRHFEVPEPCNLAFVMICSLFVADNAELDSHFDSMARALRPGGVYVLDGCVHFRVPEGVVEWTLSRRGVRVRTTLAWTFDWLQQTFAEKLLLDVDDRGRRIRCEDHSRRRALFPQEFLHYIATRPDFEFVGWWDGFDLDAPIVPGRAVQRPVVAVRRI